MEKAKRGNKRKRVKYISYDKEMKKLEKMIEEGLKKSEKILNKQRNSTY